MWLPLAKPQDRKCIRLAGWASMLGLNNSLAVVDKTGFSQKSCLQTTASQHRCPPIRRQRALHFVTVEMRWHGVDALLSNALGDRGESSSGVNYQKIQITNAMPASSRPT